MRLQTNLNVDSEPESNRINQKTMKTNHTPGPWRIFRRRSDHAPMVLGGHDDDAKAYVVSLAGCVPTVQREANTRLIAAAPDLLDALRSALLALESGAEPSSVKEKARKAIEKAINP